MAFELSRAAKALLVVAALEFLISLVLTIWRLVQLVSEVDINDPDSISDVIGAAVLLVNLVFFGIHCAVGVRREQIEALLAFCFAAVLLTAYEISRFIAKWVQHGSFYGLGTLNYVRFFSVMVLSPVSLGLAIYVLRQFGWRDYKLVGADIKLLNMFKTYKRYITTMIVDLQVGLSLATFGTVTFFVDPTQDLFDQAHIIVFCIFCVLTVAWIIVGYHGARRENKALMTTWFVLAVGEPIYIAYTLYAYWGTDDYAGYDFITVPFTVLAAVALVTLPQAVRVWAVYWAVEVRQNFGQGLRQRVFCRLDHFDDQDDDGGMGALEINF